MRQTLSYLQRLFRERGIRLKSKLGQNFLIDLNLIDLLVRTAELTKDDFVLEVGCGTGNMTAKLAEQAGAVLAVEIDQDFFQLARDTVKGRDNVTILYADVLKNKNLLNPGVLSTLAELREQKGLNRLKLVANLPYAVATPVIGNLLLSDLPVERMVVTIQWEIAEKLIATPSTKGYGALAVLVQSLARVEIIRQLAPTVFFPRPKVMSAIVSIVPNAEARAHVGDVQRLRNFLRDLYSHRRKNLRGALVAMPSHDWSKEDVDRKLAELAIDGTTRAETLDLEQHLRLCQVFG